MIFDKHHRYFWFARNVFESKNSRSSLIWRRGVFFFMIVVAAEPLVLA